MKTKTLQKYFLFEFIKLFIPISLFFILIFASSEFFWRLPDFITYKPKILTILNYLSSLVPLWFVQTLPITTMLTSLIVITNFMYTKELIIIQTLGINLKKFFLSWLILGVVLSISSFLINDKIATKGFYISQKIFNEKIKNQPSSTDILKNLFYYDTKEKSFVTIGIYNKKTYEVADVIIEKYDDENNLDIQIFSKYGIKKERILLLKNCILRKFEKNKISKESSIDTYQYNLPLDIEDFQYDYTTMQLDHLSIKELKNVVKNLKIRGQNTSRVLTEISFRYAISFLNFILIFLSISLGQNLSSQYGKLTSFVYTIAALIIYWITLSFCRTLGELNIVAPLISVWIPNILFLLAGSFLYFKK